MEFVVLMIFLLLATVILVGVGDRVGWPWPVLLFLVAAGTALVPGIPHVEVPAELMLPLFLPPLLWAMARRTSWTVIREQASTILMLSVLLVFVTTAVGAAAAWALMPGISIAGAVILASALAPPDPVAVDAVAEPAGVPRRLLNTLQTEGLFNDASSIVAFNVALSALLAHENPSLKAGFVDFIYASVLAVVIGLASGFLSAKLMDWMQLSVARNAFSWVIPFAVYLVAEEFHASGVIAIVIAAVEMHSRAKVGAEDRLTGHAFWETIEMLFTGFAFGLIGLNVRDAIQESGSALWHGVYVGVVLALLLMATRFVWLYLLYRINLAKGHKNVAPLRLQEVLVLTLGGMRGMVTLALVLSIPYGYVSWRSELTVIAIVVLVITMVIPGLLFPLLMRRLSLEHGPDAFGDAARERLIRRARDAATVVMLRESDKLPPNAVSSMQHWFAEETGTEGLDTWDNPEGRAKAQQLRQTVAEIRTRALTAAQREVMAARREPGVDPAIADEVLKSLDRMVMAARRGA